MILANYLNNHLPNFHIFDLTHNLNIKFIPNLKTVENIKKIVEKVNLNHSSTIDPNDLKEIIHAFADKKSFDDLAKLPLKHLKEVIFSALQSDDKFFKRLQAFLAHLNNQDLINLTGCDKESLKLLVDKNALIKDKALQSVLKTKGKAIWNELSAETIHFAHHIIQMLISMTGYAEFRDNTRSNYSNELPSSYSAKATLEFYLSLLAYPSVLFASCFAVVGSAPIAMAATGLFIAATLLFIPVYLRYLRPCPSQMRGLKNLNQKMIRSTECPPYERSDILYKIQNAFCQGKGVVLYGDSGNGKTTLIDTLALLIIQKRAKEGAKFLNNVQLFSVNANAFKNGNYDVLELISDYFGDYTKSFSLFIDEVGVLFNKDKDQKDGDQKDLSKSLLTFLDSFPYVICATTKAEYEKYIKNDETVNERRLKPIELKPLETDEMAAALHQYLHHVAPELSVESNININNKVFKTAIEYIVDKAAVYNPKTSKIDAAMSLLKLTISKATKINFDDLENSVSKLEKEIAVLQNQLVHSNSMESELYKNKQKELVESKKKLTEKEQKLERIKKVEKISLSLKSQGYQLAVEGSHEIPRKWLVNQAAYQLCSEFLTIQRNDLGLPTGINKNLIDGILAETKRA